MDVFINMVCDQTWQPGNYTDLTAILHACNLRFDYSGWDTLPLISKGSIVIFSCAWRNRSGRN